MARYSTEAKTPDDLRLELIEMLKSRQIISSKAAARSTSRKHGHWEQGRADCYRDLIEFLTELSITVPA